MNGITFIISYQKHYYKDVAPTLKIQKPTNKFKFINKWFILLIKQSLLAEKGLPFHNQNVCLILDISD
jgi:hypothetical protein